MGEAFVVRLSGARAAQATVRFPSEIGEDVREPAEVLKPIGAAGSSWCWAAWSWAKPRPWCTR
ncbi:hypothetical protein ACFSC4_02540 [Deinococcus malanensis]|uniref:hypothetical protein n=1 Tax=Deinococcus malanensis TaxID=1706855 RepID=UPI00362D775D